MNTPSCEEVLQALPRILAEVLEVDEDQVDITDTDQSLEDAGLDSVDRADLGLTLEKNFQLNYKLKLLKETTLQEVINIITGQEQDV